MYNILFVDAVLGSERSLEMLFPHPLSLSVVLWGN